MDEREQIEARLEGLRPVLAAGGKSIEIVSIESPKITFSVQGFCSDCGCSSSYKEGIEELVHDVCPELTEVCFVE